ncbi:LytTR family DNA-binding domain-containing protein [Alisedimentitalea sp. MJ-SS2]|uniref:LytTR family DNA-binding domain-containing protein n=1 Tax=Aliisedimentitalea sp. MJ-SS2 TaxID=3049795 RepID=UPI00291490F7|nr:LytTR family DNA-binding domain-containing protein [Alisedimentitalea sp. MJ-SS2]MDU8926079.1 LytTR family DNA-binding domain-containing protein [Alisedimentitalea sp. MJ-SS2]
MENRTIAKDLEISEEINLPQAVLVWIVATLSAAVSGPFGTYGALDFHTRLEFWAILIAVTFVLAGSLRAIVFRTFAGWALWLREACACMIMAPVLAAAIWLLAPLLLGSAYQPDIQPLSLTFYVFVIAVIIAVLRVLLSDAGLGMARVVSQAVAETPRLMERLPDEMQGDILRLTGRDHMVEVVTVHGSATVRMRFSDAIAEMDPIEGYCAHRSHWVTRSAIHEVEREPGKVFLRLANGDRVPVSRKYRPGLEEAGIV